MLPVLVVLLFGIITGGIAIFEKLAVEHAGRDAARWGATLPVENYGAAPPVPVEWFVTIANRAIDSGGYALAAGSAGRSLCVAYIEQTDLANSATDRSRFVVWDDTVPTPTAANATGGGSGAGAQCFTDAVPRDEPHVQVAIQRRLHIEAVFVRRNVDVTVESVARYEPTPP